VLLKTRTLTQLRLRSTTSSKASASPSGFYRPPPSWATTSTRPPATSPSTSEARARSRSPLTTTWPRTPSESPARSTRVGSPGLTGLGLGLSSGGGRLRGFGPPATTWSSRSVASRPSTLPRTSMRASLVRGSTPLP
ncbi:hypothetical protein TorRG33x02_330740, partial [Trema orientale]